MGQATVDLPDPSEMPPAPTSGADDLLSQLAGDEIDRLLAEAEVEKVSPPAAPPVRPAAGAMPEAPAVDKPSDTSVTASQIDDLLNDLSGANAPAAPAPAAHREPAAKATPTAKASGVAQAASQAKASSGKASPAKAAPAVSKSPATPTADLQPTAAEQIESALADPSVAARELDEALAKGSVNALPEVKGIESETSHAEKNALTDAIESIDVAEQSTRADANAAVPFYLKPLVWLNSPMELLPLAFREAIGRVALMTLANAVAVLAYVFLFRKHH